jgi:hypothetical protein
MSVITKMGERMFGVIDVVRVTSTSTRKQQKDNIFYTPLHLSDVGVIVIIHSDGRGTMARGEF